MANNDTVPVQIGPGRPMRANEDWSDNWQDGLGTERMLRRVRADVWADQAGTFYLDQSDKPDYSVMTSTSVAVPAETRTELPWTTLTKRYYRLRFVNGGSAENMKPVIYMERSGMTLSDTKLSESGLTYANRLPAYLVDSSGVEPYIGGSTDGVGTTVKRLYTDAQMSGYNGANDERVRVANVFKYSVGSAVANGGTFTVWQPASGKKYRLMGAVIRMSAPGYCAFRDGVAGSGSTFMPMPVTVSGLSLSLGQGRLSGAANNVLEIVNASGATSDFQVAVWGTEE